MSHFDPNAILRGAQLTIVGALRALRNPSLLTSQHYKQAAIAIGAGIAIRFAISIPIIGIKVLLWFLSFIFKFEYAILGENLGNSLDFVQNYVLQLPFLLMTLMRYITPTLDDVFMDSLAWVDYTYLKKHEGEDQSTLRGIYYENLKKYPTRDNNTEKKTHSKLITTFLLRFGKKAGLSFIIFSLSFVPIIGRFVLPAASFYTFQKIIGLGPAAVIFGTGIFLPRTYLVIFLQSYFASRSLMRELLEPYFCRIRFTKEQKVNWFHDREGLLFGFGVGFYLLLRIPLVGVLIYGIAEASTAYLITKITDPPPIPSEKGKFAVSQQKWTNKHEFLKLNLKEIDKQLRLPRNSMDPSSVGDTSTLISSGLESSELKKS
ncbi:hypothetical protein K3495_g5588 [Podosphaera aphanis]|nr:hypothetical protein K3495_g5588 [Podosphaera aphanis]